MFSEDLHCSGGVPCERSGRGLKNWAAGSPAIPSFKAFAVDPYAAAHYWRAVPDGTSRGLGSPGN